MHRGGKWSGDYLVVSRDDYINAEVERDSHVQRVKELIQRKDFLFAAKTKRLRRLYDDDDGGGETLADVPVRLAQYTAEPSEGPTETAYETTIEQQPPAETETPPVPDYWERRGLFLVRVHKTPRRRLFSPAEATDPSPIPIDELDVLRQTKTNSDMTEEKDIEDVWCEDLPNRELSQEWTGETFFEPLSTTMQHWTCLGARTRDEKAKNDKTPNIWPEPWE